MTQPRPMLTIGIPTYNRADAATERVRELLEGTLSPDVDILVIDNASTDGTYQRLSNQFSSSQLRVLGNATNLGYAGNLFRLIDETTSDYLLVVSDEDRIDKDGLGALIEFCKNSRPRMVSPRAQVGSNSLYRGRSETREITPEEFESASFYISGVTYSADNAKANVEAVRRLIPANSAATVYPQVLLAALAVAEGNCHFLDAIVSTQLDELETHITDPSGIQYYSLAGRWAQFQGYEAFFSMNHDAVVSRLGERRLAAMREHVRSRIFRRIADAAVKEVPALKKHLWAFSVGIVRRGIVSWLRRR